MNVKDLQALLAAADPRAEVVVLDRTEDTRFGIVRQLRLDELEALTLGKTQDEFGVRLCPWSELPRNADVGDPVPGLLIGPR
jgi:hypothetical protein